MKRDDFVAFATIIIAIPVIFAGIDALHDEKTVEMKQDIQTATIPFTDLLQDAHHSNGVISCSVCDAAWNALVQEMNTARAYWGGEFQADVKNLKNEWAQYKASVGNRAATTPIEMVKRNEPYEELMKALDEFREATNTQREWFRF